MEWRNIYRGFCMGVSDLIPGVSMVQSLLC